MVRSFSPVSNIPFSTLIACFSDSSSSPKLTSGMYIRAFGNTFWAIFSSSSTRIWKVDTGFPRLLIPTEMITVEGWITLGSESVLEWYSFNILIVWPSLMPGKHSIWSQMSSGSVIRQRLESPRMSVSLTTVGKAQGVASSPCTVGCLLTTGFEFKFAKFQIRCQHRTTKNISNDNKSRGSFGRVPNCLLSVAMLFRIKTTDEAVHVRGWHQMTKMWILSLP